MDDIFGEAIWDYHSSGEEQLLLIHNYYGDPEEMPVEVYFRSEEELSEQEQYALSLARGKILEIGAGAGALSLLLQQQDFDVAALEISPLCARVMEQRGIKNVSNSDFYFHSLNEKYDTIYLLMNGLGICGELSRLEELFVNISELLNYGGQLIFDSSNVDYVYESLPKDKYYGEIDYRYEYKGRMGDWYKWLYVDFLTMEEIANKVGFQVQLIMEDENSQYLARAFRFD